MQKTHKTASKQVIAVILLAALFSISQAFIHNETFKGNRTNPNPGMPYPRDIFYIHVADPLFDRENPEVFASVFYYGGVKVDPRRRDTRLRFVCEYLIPQQIKCTFETDKGLAWNEFFYNVYLIATDPRQDSHNVRAGIIPLMELDPRRLRAITYPLQPAWQGDTTESLNYFLIPSIVSISAQDTNFSIGIQSGIFDPITSLLSVQFHAQNLDSLAYVQVSYLAVAAIQPADYTRVSQHLAYVDAVKFLRTFRKLLKYGDDIHAPQNQVNNQGGLDTITQVLEDEDDWMKGKQNRKLSLSLPEQHSTEAAEECKGVSLIVNEITHEVEFETHKTRFSDKEINQIKEVYEYLKEDSQQEFPPIAKNTKSQNSNKNSAQISFLTQAEQLSKLQLDTLSQMFEAEFKVNSIVEKMKKCIECSEGQTFIRGRGECHSLSATMQELYAPALDEKDNIVLVDPSPEMIARLAGTNLMKQIKNGYWLLSVKATVGQVYGF